MNVLGNGSDGGHRLEDVGPGLVLYVDSTVQYVMREVSISEAWAAALGLESTMRQRGRPRKPLEK